MQPNPTALPNGFTAASSVLSLHVRSELQVIPTHWPEKCLRKRHLPFPAAEDLLAGGASCTLNCGYGRGFSVREVLDMVAKVNGRPLMIERKARRPGDPVEVIAAAGRIRDVLGWQPRHADLEQIVGDALRFGRRLLRPS